MPAAPDRPAKRECWLGCQVPHKPDQQAAQLGDGERDQHAQRGHDHGPPTPAVGSVSCARVTVKNAKATIANVTCRYQAPYWRTW
jgi:hypothetical protein